ncbi:MAG: phosphodiester glycosidase family protein [Alistipes sp.]|nr:phosphodiester glycosidase family protein [Alistipes sp.]
MRKTIVIGVLLAVMGLSGRGVAAQEAADSMAWHEARWKTVKQRGAMTVRKTQLRLFHSDQRLCYVELKPGAFRFDLVQDSLRTETSALGQRHDATVAVNGGFFRMDTPQAVACGYMRVDDRCPAQTPSDFGGAVAVDRSGNLQILPWMPREEEQTTAVDRYEDVMEVGPLLVSGGVSLRSWDESEPRHPRTCAGVRADGTVVLLVVDGRQKGAEGMALCELACVAQWMGLQEVVNLDGGGSTTLWTRPTGVVNRPSDGGRERRVCNALVATAIQ